MPEIDPSNSYATPEGPETPSTGLPTEPPVDIDRPDDQGVDQFEADMHPIEKDHSSL
ncbi:hypothetical protein [Sphingomonas faeni]|uniref:hypothetical protein n=1 Tax=Sphingomonas faeni TaxID=185950 RepID=UPI002413CC82|nr:hypothetical protein [Sphingomonas faeni]